MPNLREHDAYCEINGIDKEICTLTNRWMDAQSQTSPGCSHRELRHSSFDCFNWSSLGNTDYETSNRLQACLLHRELDRRTGKCGCKPLYE